MIEFTPHGDGTTAPYVPIRKKESNRFKIIENDKSVLVLINQEMSVHSIKIDKKFRDCSLFMMGGRFVSSIPNDMIKSDECPDECTESVMGLVHDIVKQCSLLEIDKAKETLNTLGNLLCSFDGRPFNIIIYCIDVIINTELMVNDNKIIGFRGA